MITHKPNLSLLFSGFSKGTTFSSHFGQYIDSFSIDWSQAARELNDADIDNGVNVNTFWTIILKHVTFTGSDSKKQEALSLLNQNVITLIKEFTQSTSAGT